MAALRNVYKVIRSVLFAAVITVASLVVLLYVSVSLPVVQNGIRARAEKELTAFFKAPVEIGRVEIWPFNEVRLSDVTFCDPEGRRCITVQRLGAGVGLWRRVLQQKIEITYAEIIGLQADVVQKSENAPLNIQHIIDAFKPKNKNKPPARFDLKLHNVVIRKSGVSFSRLWKPVRGSGIDFNHLEVTGLRADIAMPRLKNDDFDVIIKRLGFSEKSGLFVDGLSCRAKVTPRNITVRDFRLRLADTRLKVGDLSLDIDGFADIPRVVKETDLDLRLDIDRFTPADIAFLYPALAEVPGHYRVDMHAEGRLDDFIIRRMDIKEATGLLDLSLRGRVSGLPDVRRLSGLFNEVSIDCGEELLATLPRVIPGLSSAASRIMENAGMVAVNVKGAFSMDGERARISGTAATRQGLVDMDCDMTWHGRQIAGEFMVDTSGFDLASLVENQPVGKLVANVEGNVSVPLRDWREAAGTLTAAVPLLTVNNNTLENINATLNRKGKSLEVKTSVECALASLALEGSGMIDGSASALNLAGKIGHLDLAALGLGSKYVSSLGIGGINADVHGSNVDNLTGSVRLDGIDVKSATKEWRLRTLGLMVSGDSERKTLVLDSDAVDAEVEGQFRFSEMPAMVTGILAEALPAYVKAPAGKELAPADFSYSLTVKDAPELYDALGVPVTPGAPVRLFGTGDNNVITANVDAPYILKGNKLWKGISLKARASRNKGIDIDAGGKFPGKKGYIEAGINAEARDNGVDAMLKWSFENGADGGYVDLGMQIVNNDEGKDSYLFSFNDADIVVNGAHWGMSPARAELTGKLLDIDNLRIGNGNQYIHIDGSASDLPGDTITVTLSDIDLAYIFNTLNINYVTFGGMVSGKALASEIFSKTPYLETRDLHATDFSYNYANVGSADLYGRWENADKSVRIEADIDNGRGNHTTVDGNIFVTRDSLAINFDADKINIALIQPFLSNILDDVQGEGSGQLTLYGTFKDITMTGKAYADEASVKVGFTNVTYHGSDSVYFYKDCISVPGFRVYDRYGNSALFEGTVRHDYFHNAVVDLRLRDINRILALDTDSRQNPLYWGHVFASGAGYITGRPGYTMFSVNATTEKGSDFTFAMDETLTAQEYNFLTFTDKGKTERELTIEEEFEEKYKNQKADEETGDPSVFEMDMAVNITPDINMNVVMDPAAGDKITATGSGAMRMHYNTFTDNLDMYGRYTLNQGKYRFSFQDIILRDFTIRRGSTISFNGDPMQGILDLTAAYRVNTNLTDLDKSFATDRDLNRSSVPVEALLKVSGQLQAPDISFDLSLPTMTSDVERKVRSIISSEEMLQQQVLYLLALNRFYTPQFAGGTDGELVSVASSTLSSQVANVLSQVTDKFTLSPSFKSDRNDFSDMEVDLALSSQLFDNRLIINGNLGYRDRSVSQSTFIGDFDIEYLLSRNGQLRLKAYNHFNDAYYYLKSALTTQGVGIIYRKDFDDPFAFLKHKRKKKDKKKEPADTVTAVPVRRDSVTAPKKGTITF